jgi:hypothetical protein
MQLRSEHQRSTILPSVNALILIAFKVQIRSKFAILFILLNYFLNPLAGLFWFKPTDNAAFIRLIQKLHRFEWIQGFE